LLDPTEHKAGTRTGKFVRRLVVLRSCCSIRYVLTSVGLIGHPVVPHYRREAAAASEIRLFDERLRLEAEPFAG